MTKINLVKCNQTVQRVFPMSRFALAASGILIPLQALACSCIPQTPAEQYASSQLVMVGKALSYAKSDRGPQWTLIRFRPLEAWKGGINAYEAIEVPTQDGSCSIEILIGHEYLLYANAEFDGSLVVSPCSGTRPYDEASDDLLYLRSLPDARDDYRFGDVPLDHPYATAIETLRQTRMLTGFTDGTFRPERILVRAELAQIVAESLLPHDAIWRRQEEYAFTNSGLPFTDLPERAWYNLSVRRAYRAGIIEGYHDGTFRPAKQVTVAEAAKVIVEAMGLETPVHGAMWYERFIHAVADRGAMPPGITGPDAPLTRGEFAEMLWRLKDGVKNRDSADAEDVLGTHR
jgi:hypothetical protein